jgi:hypothetical protein
MYKSLQLFTNTFTLKTNKFTLNTNKFTSIKVIKTHKYRPKVIEKAKHFKAWMRLKLLIVLGLMK